MDKKPFVTLEQLREIERTYPTPFYLDVYKRQLYLKIHLNA